jgi:hypothetical protein
MSVSVTIFISVLAILGYVVAPASLIWGWMRWTKLPKNNSVVSILSLIGFILASVSGSLGLATVLFARAGGTSVASETFRWLFLIGLFSSLIGVIFAIGGIWRRSPLRWFAPAGTLATLAFWLLLTVFID